MNDQISINKQLIVITRQFLNEQQTHRATRALNLNAHIERDLGIDSLGRIELFRRIEQNFSIKLSDKTMAEAQTLSEIAEAVYLSGPTTTLKERSFAPQLEGVSIDFSKIQTLQQALIYYAETEPDRPHIYLQDEYGKEKIITYSDLYLGAKKITYGLLARGIQPLETIAIMLPTSEDFFFAFYGILLAGAIPVPIYPPFRPDKIEEYARREAKILNNAEIRILITFAKAELLSKLLKTFIPSLKDVLTVTALKMEKEIPFKLKYDPDSPAFIQYTSGSTGDPKGVLLHHRNVISNMHAIAEDIQLKPTDICVSWLPLYHDMGLMSWLTSLFYGMPITLLSPLTFINRPENWLWAIHYHRATLSAGPNFAYELCVKKIDDEAIEGLDLSSWRLAFNGAEAVNPDTLERFNKKFKPFGLKRTTLFPVYGLAENTVALAFPTLNKPPRIDSVDRDKIQSELRAVPSASKNALRFVSSGQAITGHQLRVVDAENKLLPERHIGRIQFSGPSAMRGYHNNPEATRKIYHAGWWDTGDLGYLADDDLFITGRSKDLIIKGGRNINPEAIEELVTQLQGIRKGCTIAFGALDQETGTEKLVIVAESSETDETLREKLIAEISDTVLTHIGIAADDIIIVPAHTIPKTSSGKLQRHALKQDYIAGNIHRKRSKIKWHYLRFLSQVAKKKMAQVINKLLRFIYTLYIWTVFGITFFVFWLLIMITPKVTGLHLVKLWARILFSLVTYPVEVEGKEHLQTTPPVIFAANHCSFADTVLLLATLPVGTVFISKRELLDNPFLGSLIRKLNFITVNRFDFAKNLLDTEIIEKTLYSRHSILIFPEGTFTYAIGLRPFKTGAFRLAADTETPIQPIALSGMRKFLRSGTFLFRPSRIKLTVLPPIYPKGNSWEEVNRLKLHVHNLIAEHSGEPKIDVVAAGPLVNPDDVG